MNLGSMDTLTPLVPLIYQYGISLLFCVFSHFLQFSVYRSFISLFKFIFKHFIGFDSILKRTVFFIFQIVHCYCIEIQLIFIC